MNKISHAHTRGSSEARPKIFATVAESALTHSVLHMQNYDNLGTIGEGTFGVVAKCRHRPTGANVAVKMFKDFDKQVRDNLCRKIIRPHKSVQDGSLHCEPETSWRQEGVEAPSALCACMPATPPDLNLQSNLSPIDEIIARPNLGMLFGPTPLPSAIVQRAAQTICTQRIKLCVRAHAHVHTQRLSHSEVHSSKCLQWKNTKHVRATVSALLEHTIYT